MKLSTLLALTRLRRTTRRYKQLRRKYKDADLHTLMNEAVNDGYYTEMFLVNIDRDAYLRELKR